MTEVDAPDGTPIAPPTWVSPIGTLETATSSKSVDLGCGALPAAPSGSTFITRKDAKGNCIYARSLPLPKLSAVMDPMGRVVVTGSAGAAPIDLGGGPLAPLGSKDLILAELDDAGNHLWSRRFGGPGVSFVSPRDWHNRPAPPAAVWTSNAGDVYLVTSFDGTYPPASIHVQAVDFGGGAVSAQARSPIVASYSPSGEHRWSRAYHLTTDYDPGLNVAVDGCGSVVIASPFALAPDCNSSQPGPTIARFAP